jgi:hypothetical protein
MASERRPCTVAEAKAGLHALTVLDGEWTSLANFPGESYANATALRLRRCARRAFRSYLCSLPTSSEAVTGGVDGEFGASPPTFAKYLSRWALMLYVSTSHPHHPTRHVPPDLQHWAWRPGGCAGESGLQADVCSGRKGGQKGRLAALISRSSEGHALLGRVRGHVGLADASDAATALRRGGRSLAGLWWASVLVGWMTASLGPCGRSIRDSALSTAGVEAGREAAGCSREVAVHMRRGDACERWATLGDGRLDPEGDCGGAVGRPCFGAAVYLQGIRWVLRHVRGKGGKGDGKGDGRGDGRCGVALRLASDSASAVAELRGGLGGGLGGGRLGAARLIHLEASSRGTGWGGVAELRPGATRRHAPADFIESRAARGLVNRSAAAATGLQDLSLLREAASSHGGAGFVGSAASWFSRLAYLVVAGRAPLLPPFAMVDGPWQELWWSRRAGELCAQKPQEQEEAAATPAATPAAAHRAPPRVPPLPAPVEGYCGVTTISSQQACNLEAMGLQPQVRPRAATPGEPRPQPYVTPGVRLGAVGLLPVAQPRRVRACVPRLRALLLHLLLARQCRLLLVLHVRPRAAAHALRRTGGLPDVRPHGGLRGLWQVPHAQGPVRRGAVAPRRGAAH